MSTFSPLQMSQIDKMAALESDAFGMPLDRCEQWITRTGIENWRALSDGQGEICGGLIRIPMAQWYGGRAVSMTGLAGVAVSSFARGKGVGQALMRGALDEMHSEGCALSALYGSTTSFYRRCGYERAGARYMIEVPIRELPGRSGPLQVRPLTDSDHHEVEALQAQHVQGQACLLRGPYLWQRVRGPRGMTAKGYGFYRGSTLEGYTYLVSSAGQGFTDGTLEASDLCLTSADAVATFLGLLAGHRAFFTTARWPSAACSPLLFLLDEPWSYQMTLNEHWMLRLVHLQKALEGRGYSPHLQGELHLSVDDPWFPQNHGEWVLEVSGGEAHLRRGGRGDLSVDIGSLAALYSGFASAQELYLAGRLRAEGEAITLATALFGGPAPELVDFF